MERDDKEGSNNARQREKGRDREKEALCLISSPGESCGGAEEEHGMFSNWPCSEERQEEEKQDRREGGRGGGGGVVTGL